MYKTRWSLFQICILRSIGLVKELYACVRLFYKYQRDVVIKLLLITSSKTIVKLSKWTFFCIS